MLPGLNFTSDKGEEEEAGKGMKKEGVVWKKANKQRRSVFSSKAEGDTPRPEFTVSVCIHLNMFSSF